MTDAEKTQAIRILIADDHPIVCEGLAALINRRSDMLVVAEAHNGREAIELFRQHNPDLILLDLRMPGIDGIEACRTIHTESPTTRMIILTTYDDDEALSQAQQAGAAAYLVKDAPRQELLASIRAVYRGESSFPEKMLSSCPKHKPEVELTSRERDVLGLLGEGKSNREISAALAIAEGTVKLHLNNIFSKLGVNSRVEALTLALKRGLLQLK